MKNYINSLLADISYIDFINIGGIWQNTAFNTDANARNITLSEQNFFQENFSIVNQTSFGTGFSATTFQIKTNNVPGYSIGDIFVGYRGTEDTTLGIFTDGLYTDLGNVSLGTNVFY